MEFETLGLHPKVVQSIIEKGYTEPTNIQRETIPVILSGRDILGSSQTGTGKTASFALPILSMLEKHSVLRCLVLTPTRELAHQVSENFRFYGKHLGLNYSLIYGGVRYQRQMKEISQRPDVMVATPGRLIEFLKDGYLKLDTLKYLVLDEVDRMLDMGFIDAIRSIINFCPKQRQTILFSATMPQSIRTLANWVLTNPAEVRMQVQTSTAETIQHAVYPVDSIQKFDLLIHILNKIGDHTSIIFTRTKVEADRVGRWLKQNDHKAAVMHADRSQNERQQALEGFRKGTYKVLVATDIASRGLDIQGVKHVINYNAPGFPEDYVHRIGRTGRAQTEGNAYTLLSSEDIQSLRKIERFLKMPITKKMYEDFEYRNAPSIESADTTSRKRNRGYVPASRSRGNSQQRYSTRRRG